MNDYTSRVYDPSNQINFKSTTIISSLLDYNDACILVKEKITIKRAGADQATKNAD